MDVELVQDARADLGEGPVWDPRTGELIWVDIMAGVVHRLDPRSGADRPLTVGQPVGAVCPRAARRLCGRASRRHRRPERVRRARLHRRINVPIGIVAVVLGLRLLPESYGARERLDLVGVGLVSTGVVALVWALTRSGDVGWANAEIVGSLAAGTVLLAVFLWWEHRVAEPMVPLRLFASRDFAIGNLTTFLMSGAIFAGGLLVTEEFQLARHFSPVGAGLRLLPFFATPMLVSPVAGALSDRIGHRPIIVVGLSMLTAGFAWVAWRGSLDTSWIELVIALLVAGVGISMALPTVPTAVLSAVAPQEMGKASGVNYMAQRFGAVFAVAIGSTVFASYGGLTNPAAVTSGFKPALWACCVFAGLGALAATAMSARAKPAAGVEPAGVAVAA